MPPRWNPWTHLQAVQFDYEKAPKMRQVRLCGPSPVAGEPARIAVSGVEVDVVIVSVVPGLLTVTVKRTPAKAADTGKQTQKRRGLRATDRRDAVAHGHVTTAQSVCPHPGRHQATERVGR
jgi:hypothetical protein